MVNRGGDRIKIDCGGKYSGNRHYVIMVIVMVAAIVGKLTGGTTEKE